MAKTLSLKKFSLYRIMLLFRRDFMEASRSAAIIAAAVFGIVFFLVFISNFHGEKVDHSSLLQFFITMGGLIFTSMSFREIHLRDRNIAYLLLPASVEEKFAERLLSVTIAWCLFAIISYALCANAAVLINYLFFRNSDPVFYNPLSAEIITGLPYYIINSSVFFLGAVHFRKMHFLKTIISLFLFSAVFLALTALMARIIFSREAGLIADCSFSNGFESFELYFERGDYRQMAEAVLLALKVLYYALLAPFLWFAAYLKLREAEVRNGI